MENKTENTYTTSKVKVVENHPERPFPKEKASLEKMITKIQRIVYSWKTVPRSLDKEELCQKILVECYEKQQSVTGSWVARRMIDEMRQLNTRKRHEEAASQSRSEIPEKQTPTETSDKQDLINKIMHNAELGTKEQNIIWRSFYRNETLREISQQEQIGLATTQRLFHSAMKKLKLTAEKTAEGTQQ